MADFLLFLGKLNLAMGAAIILAYLLRRPLRAQFGAPSAYAIWLLVPITGLAILLPPRVAAPPTAPLAHLQTLAGQYPPAPMSVIRQIAHHALRITDKLTGQSAPVYPAIAAPAAASGYRTPDDAMLLFAAWALGAVLMALYLARLQARFHATMRLGEAGPAVLGFFRPRVVMPDSFQEQFTAPEQAAILAHERVHLARQDARINALAASLRCLCWFNPLVHLGAAWLRIDQELACDATAVAGLVSRRDYANALVKSQMMVTALPLGCNWPGSQHPLIERIALLKCKRPGTARRIAGAGFVMFAATFAGLGAWAAQPPDPAKFIASPRLDNQIALATPPAMTPAMTPAPGQNARETAAGNTGPNQPVADANPIGSGHPLDAAKNVPASNPISAAPSPAEMPNTGRAEAPATVGASNDRPAAPVQPASEAPRAAAATPNDQPVAFTTPATPDASAVPVAAVNDEFISDYELRQRMALFISLSGLKPNTEDLKRIRGQILDQMDNEIIQLQAAVKKHITVSPGEVDKAINNLLSQNHLTMEQLRNVLNQAGASEVALRSQITAQLAWQKTVQDQYSNRINISPSQIDAEHQRYAEGATKPHFLVSEIFLPVTNPEQDADVLKNAQGIVGQIQAGASFGAVAHQFSQNPAAAQGGAIGWVHEGQLAPELNDALTKMTPGGLSSPIRSAGGYYILNLQARQEPLDR